MARRHLPILPTLADILYVTPRPDRARRICGNCTFWSSEDWRCEVHAANVRILSRDVCGYWVGGTPQLRRKKRTRLEPVSPKYSGLMLAPFGTACDNCRWYEGRRGRDGRGRCMAARDEKDLQGPRVAARGCCARWEATAPFVKFP